MKQNNVIIASNGKETLLFINGKVYGDNVTGVSFEHNVKEKRSNAEIRITVDTLPVEDSASRESFERFLNIIMEGKQNNPNALKDVQGAASKSLETERKDKKLSFRIPELEKEVRKFKDSEGMSERHKGVTSLQYVNSAVVQVSFGIYESDWYLLQESGIWNRFCDFLEETQNRSNQMSLQEKIDLLGE